MRALSYFIGLLLAISSSLAGVSRSSVGSRIIDGELIYSATPYHVSITQDGEHICSGFIFNNKTVITTANCVQNKPLSSLNVVINQYSLISPDPGEESISVFKVTIKDDYNNTTLFNDIAIIQLSKELSLLPYLGGAQSQHRPCCVRYDEFLPTQQYYERIKFEGWGITEPDGAGAQKLRKANVTVSPNSLCGEIYGAEEYQASTMLCISNLPNNLTGTVTTGPCTYDEGSPLVLGEIKNYFDLAVIGIYSKNKNCDVSKPSVFTRLSAHYAWINRVAGAQPSDCYEETKP